MGQPVELLSMDNALYVVECGCTNVSYLSRHDCKTGRPVTLLDLGISEEKCENCQLHPWVILPLNHPTVVEVDKIQGEIIDLFRQIAATDLEIGEVECAELAMPSSSHL